MRRLIVRKQTASHGFTLVELLIVISIIGVLVALLMPAINAARESGRRAQCMNNAAQLAKACAQHETAQTCFPGGGWGWGWTGDADGGVGMHQPGGWIYNILPYIDQADLHDLGKGLGPIGSSAKSTQHTQRVGKPLSITICPTRRAVRAFAMDPGHPAGYMNYNLPSPALVGRSDYASNGGDKITKPESIQGLWPTNCGNRPDCGPSSVPNEATLIQMKNIADAYGATGIDYPLGSISSAQVKTGATYCYLLGEKSLDPNKYTTGTSDGDNENQYVGHNQDTSRWVIDLPIQDKPSVDNTFAFGSAHSAGFNMAFCDGSVRKMNYSIDAVIHQQLGNRLGTGPNGPLTQLQKLNDVSSQ
jgi:prepilin-type N-terminal cleavage/methylation domain-containing protein/prepilin-type processing-associated H-X9-DG protein